MPTAVIGRLRRSADFEKVLATRPAGRSPHFAVHFVAGVPSMPRAPVVPELSTDDAPIVTKPVDDFAGPHGPWWGAVVPKRHARRAVTRSLLKRQMRETVRRYEARLPPGLWVLRLRAPFDRQAFRSAASLALKAAARSELDGLLARVCRAG